MFVFFNSKLKTQNLKLLYRRPYNSFVVELTEMVKHSAFL